MGGLARCFSGPNLQEKDLTSDRPEHAFTPKKLWVQVLVLGKYPKPIPKKHKFFGFIPKTKNPKKTKFFCNFFFKVSTKKFGFFGFGYKPKKFGFLGVGFGCIPKPKPRPTFFWV